MSGLEKPRIMCWPASRARKIWTSSRATGLKALAVRLGAICFRGRDAVQAADGVGGIVDLGQGVEIPAVGGQGDILVTK